MNACGDVSLSAEDAHESYHAESARGPCCWRRQFVEQFFQCSECSQHFGAMAAEEAALAVTTKRDAVLWAWRAHNIVSALALPL